MGSALILSAFFLDVLLGDHPRLPHPVKLMGKMAAFIERRFMPEGKGRHLRFKGAVLTFTITGISVLCALFMLYFSEKLHPFAGSALWVILAYTCLAGGDLRSHANRVRKAAEAGDLKRSRRELSSIVGRDTGNLSKISIIKAAVESIAESSNDGIIAPLFFLVIGGPAAAIGYKAVNTLDSLVGYNNDRYREFGWFAAKADDAANFIPARVTGVLIAVSSFIAGKGFMPSAKTMRRDGRKHPSPNSGIPEAAVAGALGLKLGGPSSYFGIPSRKPYIGEDITPADPSAIKSALYISFISSLLMVLSGTGLRWLI